MSYISSKDMLTSSTGLVLVEFFYPATHLRAALHGCSGE